MVNGNLESAAAKRSSRDAYPRASRPDLRGLDGVTTGFAAGLGPWLAVPLLAVVLAQHSSLQHEVIHGHPTANQRLNEALVVPALGLLIPFRRFRDMHLAHHYDPLLTDPHDDPESNYLDPTVWARLRRPVRALLAANNTLLGRMVIGPVVGMVVLWRDDLAGVAGRRPSACGTPGCTISRGSCRWWHGWLLVGTMAWWQYLAGCWLALSILRIRTFLEHQAHERAAGAQRDHRGSGAAVDPVSQQQFPCGAPREPTASLVSAAAGIRAPARALAGAQRRLCLPLLWRGVAAAPAASQGSGRASDLDPAGAGPAAWRASGVGAAAAAMSAGLAALPMYDWPEVADATDRLWAAIRDSLRAAGVAAPEALDREPRARRGLDASASGAGADLRAAVRARAGRQGDADRGGRLCGAGVSAGMVPQRRRGSRRRSPRPRSPISAAHGSRSTDSNSQSGWGSILHHAAPLAREGRFFGEVVVSGAHAVSVSLVAEGEADLAAIDFVSWRLARRFRPEAARLRVLMLSDPTPGLPLIAALGTDVSRHAAAIRRAIEGLDATTRRELGLAGFAPLMPDDYRLIADRMTDAAVLIN